MCLRTWKGHADFFNCEKQDKEQQDKNKRVCIGEGERGKRGEGILLMRI